MAEPDSGSETGPPAEESGLRGMGQSAIVYGAGILMARVLTFALLPVYTRYLGTEDYGTMALIEMTLDVVSIIAGAQLAQGVFRYYHKTDDPDTRKAVVSTALLALAASYFAVAVVVFVLAPTFSRHLFDDPDRAILIRIAAGGLLAQSLLIVPLAYARVRDRAKLFVAANLGKAVLGAAINIYLLAVVGLGVMSIFISAAVSGAIVSGGMLWWTFREVGFGWSPGAIRDLLRFGVPMVGMQFATFAFTFGDRYILQVYSNESAVGLYSMAYSFAFLLTAVGYTPFEQVWAPRRFVVARSANRDRPLNDVFRWISILIITLALGMSLFIGDVLRIMTTSEFHEAANLVHLILLAYVIHGWTQMQDLGILVQERTEYLMLINWVAAGLALTCFWLLVPRYGAFGASIGTAAAALLRWALTYSVSQALWRVEYRWAAVLLTLALAVPFALVGIFLVPEPLVLSIALRTVLYAAYFLILWHSGIISVDERAWLRMQISERIPKVMGARPPKRRAM